MANNNRKILALPLVPASGLTNDDVMLVVSDNTTSQTNIGDFKAFVGASDFYVTGGTLNSGTTLTLDRNDDVSVNIDMSGFISTGHTKQFPGNQEEGSLSVTGDSQSTGIVLVGSPIVSSRVDVIVNGVIYNVGDGVKTTDFYFSPNGGVTAKTLSTLTLGDELIFNGITSGIITLDGNDKISINYSVLI